MVSFTMLWGNLLTCSFIINWSMCSYPNLSPDVCQHCANSKQDCGCYKFSAKFLWGVNVIITRASKSLGSLSAWGKKWCKWLSKLCWDLPWGTQFSHLNPLKLMFLFSSYFRISVFTNGSILRRYIHICTT